MTKKLRVAEKQTQRKHSRAFNYTRGQVNLNFSLRLDGAELNDFLIILKESIADVEEEINHQKDLNEKNKEANKEANKQQADDKDTRSV